VLLLHIRPDISQLYQRTVRIPFASAKHASIAKQAIDVDAELHPYAVERFLTVEDDNLIAWVCIVDITADDLTLIVRTFKTLTIRLARLTVNGFLENVELVTQTLGEFGEDAANAM
jgi:EKC/KEOPS complex subunit PCC1/LAGE3